MMDYNTITDADAPGNADKNLMSLPLDSELLGEGVDVMSIFVMAGVLLMAASETEDSDLLWCINHDSFPFKKPLMEAQVGPLRLGSGHRTFIHALNNPIFGGLTSCQQMFTVCFCCSSIQCSPFWSKQANDQMLWSC